MADTSRLVTLGKIVAEALVLSEKPKSKAHLFFQMLTNGVRDLKLFHDSTIRRVIVAMDANYVVDFPSDLLSFVRIGIPVNGRLHTFTEDKNLLAITTVTDVYDWTDAVDERDTVGYGTRGGKNTDYFNIDWENDRIVFNSPSQRSEVILHYTSSGIDLTTETSIPVVAKMAMIAYIIWRDALYDKKTPYTQTQLLSDDYAVEIEKYRMLGISIESIHDTIRKSYRQGPKR